MCFLFSFTKGWICTALWIKPQFWTIMTAAIYLSIGTFLRKFLYTSIPSYFFSIDRLIVVHFFLLLMVCSRCLVHHPYDLQVGKSYCISRRNTPFRSVPLRILSIPSSVRQTKTKMAAPVKRFIFFVTLILNALTHFYIACCVLLCMQYNVNLCLFSSWFVEEAKVANNDWSSCAPSKGLNLYSFGGQLLTKMSIG